MANEVPKLVLLPSSTVYALLKDFLLYMKGKAKYVKRLEDNLSKMIAELAIFYSRKKEIDQHLETAVSKEKSDEYYILIKQFEGFHIRCSKFVDKYQGYCQNLNLPRFHGEDISSATDVLGALQEQKPTILTRKFFQLAELSRKIDELRHDILYVTDKLKLDNLLRDKKIEAVDVKHGDIDFPSSAKYVNEILKHLSEDGNRSIGILGPIGVGKTAVLKKLNNRLEHTSFPLFGMAMKRKFEFVIWIEYHKQRGARDDTTLVIQDVIMERLKLERKEANSIGQNANIISTFLSEKKYILLIDQVVSDINLDEVGIHTDHKLGKVVIASSSRKVATRMSDQLVEIQPLSENDALHLFQEVCGTIHDRCKTYAESIIRSCGGLPSVIKLVAYHLKGVGNEEVWSDVKRLLQSETRGKLQKLAAVGNAYKLVYDNLEKSHKKCLLFVTLFPSDHKIYKDYLVECWNAEGFLEDVPVLRSARERGATTLRELTDQYLLENHSDKHIKMPEYFRKVAAEQEYPGENGSLSWVPREFHPLRDETWRTSKRMSLICCKSILPSEPSCENISTLLMQCNSDLVSLGDMFFLNMQKLCILDLHRTMITSLPNSLSRLVNLKCLYLNDCPLLAELPEVKMLENLELLDIRGTSVRALPNEISVKLRCLRISFSRRGCNQYGECREMVMTIPPDHIRRLRDLEELTIEAGCCSEAWDAIADQIVGELASLKRLSTLNFHFPKVKTLQIFVGQSQSLQNTNTHWSTNTLRSFNISIGCCEMRLPYDSKISNISPERRLTFSSTDEEFTSVKEVLRQANSFELVGDSRVRSLSDFILKNVGALEVCVVKNCGKMKTLVRNERTREKKFAILQYLKKLHLVDLKELQTIWKGPISSRSLANVKDLTLFGCSGLTTVLNHELAKALSSLEYVRVENCSKVEEIVNVEITNEHAISEDVDLSNMLNKVTTVEMVDLPMLQRICNNTSMKWRSLARIVAVRCNRLGDVRLLLRNAENLETVEFIVME